jgi:hypothetical protein
MAAFTAFLISSLVASGLSAAEQIAAGRASKRAGRAAQDASNSEADLADVNANVALAQATDALKRGQEQEARYKENVSVLLGAQKAAFAGANVDVTSGSAVDVKLDAERLAELDVQTIRANAYREAQGYRVRANDLATRARIARKTGVFQAAAGDAAVGASHIAAAGTILGTTSSLLEAKYGYLWRK